jgi:hypothetical protein
MLPVERGASIVATSGDGAFRAPPGAGPRRVKAMEVPEAARFSMPYDEVTRHHGGLTPWGLLHRPPFRLSSCGRAMRPWPLHLHMVH